LLCSFAALARLVECDACVATLLFDLAQASPGFYQLPTAGGADVFAEVKPAGERLKGVSVALVLQPVHERMIVRIAARAELRPTEACAAARNCQSPSSHNRRAMKRMLPQEQVDANPPTDDTPQLAWGERGLVGVHRERKQYHGIVTGPHQLRVKASQLPCAADYDHVTPERRRPGQLTAAALLLRRERMSGSTPISRG